MEIISQLLLFVFALASVDSQAITTSSGELLGYERNDISNYTIDVKSCSYSYFAYWFKAVDECKNQNKQLLCYKSKEEIDNILNYLRVLTYSSDSQELWLYNRDCSTTKKEEGFSITFEKSKNEISHNFDKRTPFYETKRFVCCSNVFGPCSDYMCENDGICSIQDQKPVCTCKTPYSGEFCEISPCTNYTCENGGTCKFNWNEPQCKCVEPYWGDFCQIDPCTTNPCYNGGSCSFKDENPICDCPLPYTGELCEADPCTNYTLCLNKGYCIFENQDYEAECKCHTPYFGDFCEKDPCTDNPCKNGGKCNVEHNEAVCECLKPYIGKFCDIDSRYVGVMSLLGVLIALVLLLLICGGFYLSKIVELLRMSSRSSGAYAHQNNRP